MLIYAIAVLGNAMAADLGISQTLVFGAFSGSLVVSGLVGPRVGALIDRRGGRWVLSWGAAGAAASLGAARDGAVAADVRAGVGTGRHRARR